MAVHIQDPENHPTVLGHIGSAVTLVEAGTDSVGGREVGVSRQDGTNLTRAVGYLCLRRTWRSLAFRVSSKREIAGGLPSLVAVEENYVNLWLWEGRRDRYFASYCCSQPGGKGRVSVESDKHVASSTTSAG